MQRELKSSDIGKDLKSSLRDFKRINGEFFDNKQAAILPEIGMGLGSLKVLRLHRISLAGFT